MFSNVLPKLIPDRQPGGALAASYNKLAQDSFNRDLLEAKARYAPLTAAAQAASQMAYANLMGPQFAAKLMGNEAILANIKDPVKRQALSTMLTKAGITVGDQGSQGVSQEGSNYLNMPPPAPSLLRDIVQGIKSRFSSSQPGQQQTTNAFRQPQVGQQPGLTQNVLLQEQRGQPTYQGTGADSGYRYDKEGRNIVATPEEVADVAKQRQSKQIQKSIESSKESPLEPIYVPSNTEPTWSETVSQYRSEQEEGKEAGKLRAQDIQDLNKTSFNADTALSTLDHLNHQVSSPAMREIRKVPLAGQHEIAWYAKEGTPAQQQLIGNLVTGMGTIIKDSARDFPGQFRKGEQALLEGMKPNPGDTVDVMIGKLESLTTMTKLLRERSALTSKYMSKFHIDKLKASELADKQINGDQIRLKIHDRLNPTKTIRNRKTGETKTVPISEARKLLGEENV